MAAPELARERVSAPSAPARLRWTVLLFCVIVVALLAAQVLLHGPMLEIDLDISRWFAQHRDPRLAEFMLAVSNLHQTWKVLVATIAVAAWRCWRNDWDAARGLLVVPAGMLLNVAVKDSVQRARPAWDDPLVHLASYSFPSGHAAASTVFYGMCCALVFARTRSRVWRAVAATVAVVMVLLVSFSRVYLGAHYPMDVIGGIALGTACVALFLRFLRR